MRDALEHIVDAFRRRVKRWLYRSSVTGRFVSRDYAEAHPDTTYRTEKL